MRRISLAASVCVMLLSGLAQPAHGQVGTITGTVTDRDTGGPLPTVQVFVEGTSIGALTNNSGAFTLTDVPVGTHTVIAQRIGYGESRLSNVRTTAGESTSITFALAGTVLTLQEVVATGLVDPTAGVQSPITVDRISRENMPVMAAGAAAENLAGVVAGVSQRRPSGQPGEETVVMLRTPTSIKQAGTPMYVIDGVVVGSGTANIETLDIESIEVIKGAAAASLYGSRAASGVISIRTRRGNDLPLDQMQITVRTELGTSGTLKDVNFPTHHAYLMNESQTAYVDRQGNVVDRSRRVMPANPQLAFMDKAYPGPVFDNTAAIIGNPGRFLTNSVTVAQNSANTNFAISATQRIEEGVLVQNGGYKLNSMRLNLDHRFTDNIQLAFSGYHSRDWRDNVDVSFDNVLFAPVDLDMTAKDENGEYIRIPDAEFPFENPMWLQGAHDDHRWRARTLASLSLRADPLSWMSVSGNVSVDREDATRKDYVPKGTPEGLADINEGLGRIGIDNTMNDAWNGEAQMQLRRDFGALNTRTTFRGIFELDRFRSVESDGIDFIVNGVPTLEATRVQTSESQETEVRSLGWLVDTALDYENRYIATLLYRYDGSSLFGPDNRWHPYYRAALKWRLSEERWFNIPGVTEFGLSYARGTAGGRPPFTAQYETWAVGSNGLTRGALGNRNLAPEHTLEQEVALDVIFNNNVSVELNHSWHWTEDQLVSSTIPSFTGYATQWRNGGILSGHTTEVAVEALVRQTDTSRWVTRVVADFSQGKIEDWPFVCEQPSYGRVCTGATIYEKWNIPYLTDPVDLEKHNGGAAADHADEFMVNDDGLLVWVGKGNRYTDQLWGTSTRIGNQTYFFGMPLVLRDAFGNFTSAHTSDGAHVNFGWLNTLQWRGVTFHSQMQAVVGGVLPSHGWVSLIGRNRHPLMDQSTKPDELKKPAAYYYQFQNSITSIFMEEPQTFLKLRTLSANYTLNPSQLSRFGLSNVGLSSLSFGVIGRNLLTFTAWSGHDPESGFRPDSRVNFQTNTYPATKQFTFEVQATF